MYRAQDQTPADLRVGKGLETLDSGVDVGRWDLRMDEPDGRR